MTTKVIVRSLFWVLFFLCAVLPLILISLPAGSIYAPGIFVYISDLPPFAVIPLLLLCTFCRGQLGMLSTVGLLVATLWYVVLIYFGAHK